MLYVRARVRARTAYTISEQNGFFRAGFHPPVTRLTPYFFYIYIKVAKLRGRICRCGLLPYAAVAEKITASELGAPYRQAASSATPCSTSRLPIFLRKVRKSACAGGRRADGKGSANQQRYYSRNSAKRPTTTPAPRCAGDVETPASGILDWERRSNRCRRPMSMSSRSSGLSSREMRS